MNLKLGMIYKDDKMINHRSLVKVLLNPIFRCFGFCVATKFENNKLGGIVLIKCGRKNKLNWSYNIDNIDIIKKRRII